MFLLLYIALGSLAETVVTVPTLPSAFVGLTEALREACVGRRAQES